MTTEKKSTPTVKLTPTFTIGENVTHKATGQTHKILALDHPAKRVRLQNLITWTPIEAIEKTI